jgi:hypothetical protein
MPTAAIPQAEEEDVSLPEPVVVTPTHRRARVKGTWTMFYGDQMFDFIDGQTYTLPTELFDYLRTRGNIYDTMA